MPNNTTARLRTTTKRRLRQWLPHDVLMRRWQRLAQDYEPADHIRDLDEIPLVWWPVAPNFGDAAAPWLMEKMTGKPAVRATPGETPEQANYLTIGSIVKRATPQSTVWGSGAFGNELKEQLEPQAKYAAVRGPLTRQVLANTKIQAPPVYGDPALVAPLYFNPKVEKKHEVGMVVRWSEKTWKKSDVGDGVKIIDLKTNDVEDVLLQMLSCKRIISSSLHGLIFADAYGIPNAWRRSETGNGGIFKFYDYFISVNKHREPIQYRIEKQGLGRDSLMRHFDFDGRTIEFDYRKLLNACPFMQRVKTS